MKKKYDLIVVGAGPAGLMAAKTAAENGLKVALIERKETITDINRACSMMLVSLAGQYLGERIILNTRDKRLCFPRYGFSIPYDGPHQNFYTWVIYSHGGHKIQLGDYEENFRKKDEGRASAVYNKESLLKSLLREVVALQVDIFPACNVTHSMKVGSDVSVFTSEGRTFTGTFVIGADGRQSRLAQTLGMNKERKFFATSISCGYEMVGVEPPEKYALSQIFLNETPPMRIWMTPRTDKDTHFVMFTSLNPARDYDNVLEKVTRKGFFAHWFRNAEIKRKLSSVGNMCSHIVDPYRDQVLLVSDAVWCAEAEMTGAVISGWKAASAVSFALAEGRISRDGVRSYLDWWQSEVVSAYDYRDMLRNAVLPYVLTPLEIDYLFSLIKKPLPSIFDPYETPKLIGNALAEVMPVVQKEKPVIIQKLSKVPTTPLEIAFKGCIRAGYPSRMFL